jgi:hypothetical protein
MKYLNKPHFKPLGALPGLPDEWCPSWACILPNGMTGRGKTPQQALDQARAVEEAFSRVLQNQRDRHRRLRVRKEPGEEVKV